MGSKSKVIQFPKMPTSEEEKEIDCSVTPDDMEQVHKKNCIEKCECGCNTFDSPKDAIRVFQIVNGKASFQFEQVLSQDRVFICCNCGKKYTSDNIKFNLEEHFARIENQIKGK